MSDEVKPMPPEDRKKLVCYGEAYKNIARNLLLQAISGTQPLAVIESIAPDGMVTLGNQHDIGLFDLNQQVFATHWGKTLPGAGYVVFIDRSNSTLRLAPSMGGASGAIDGWAVGDILFGEPGPTHKWTHDWPGRDQADVDALNAIPRKKFEDAYARALAEHEARVKAATKP